MVEWIRTSRFSKEEHSNQNLSGSEVYHMNSLISLIKNTLFSKLHCQKGFDLIPFSYKMVGAGGRCRALPAGRCGVPRQSQPRW